jgi:Ca2+-transporting ATPase
MRIKIKYPLAESHAFSVEEILLEFQTNPRDGINQSEAENRTKEFGLNIYETKKQKSVLLMFFMQFKSPIVYLLLFAATVTLYFQHYIEAMAILAVILINALIGFFMELQARNSMKALKEMDVTFSKVIRDKKIREIPSE